MRRYNLAFTLPLVAAVYHMPAQAAPERRAWIVHVGAGRLSAKDDARVHVLEKAIPGAAVDVDPRYTGVIEVGRFVGSAFSVNITAGLPVKQKIGASGSISAIGQLGRMTYGPAAATLLWHPLRNTAVRPYVGAGVAYMHVFDANDSAVRALHVDNDIGPAVQGGVEVSAAPAWGVFVDAKKAFLRTDATGSLGGAPVLAHLRLDPLVLHTGIAFRF
jgi:outer membrane protein